MALLLPLHVAAGVIALLSVPVALGAGKRKGLHVVAGTTFAVGMLVVAVTGIGMVLLGADVFLAGISLFSSYLAASGWRDIRRRGPWAAPDRLLAALIGVAAALMAGIGVARLDDDRTIGVTLLVFAGIALGLFAFDVVRLLRPAPKLRGRTVDHLIKMQSATIAALTAFLVVNVDNEGLIMWLGPTVVITPVISWWTYQVAFEGWRPPPRSSIGA